MQWAEIGGKARLLVRDREERLALMERQGIEKCFLFPTLGVGMEQALRHDLPAQRAAEVGVTVAYHGGDYGYSEYVSAWGETDEFESFKRDLLGAERLLMGSDYPHAEGLADPTSYVDELDGFSAAEIHLLMRENALGLATRRPASAA